MQQDEGGASCAKSCRNANWKLHMVLTIFYGVHWPQETNAHWARRRGFRPSCN